MTRESFDARIVPLSAAQPIATGDLVSRLKDLHLHLARLDQDTADLAALQATATNLVAPSLVAHRDKAVRSLVGCCLADVLRLFAPDAPYTESELKTIFSLFINQISYIADPSGPYFENYYYLLESLAVVKSVILLTDLNAEDLIITLFKNIYGFIKPDFQKNIYGFLLQLLQCLVEESPNINNDIIEIVVSQFDKPNNYMTRQLSIDLCNAVTDKLQRYICQYFGELFYSAMKGSSKSEDIENDDQEDDEEDEPALKRKAVAISQADFKYAHKLILEMNSTCRGVLLNVIPLFEDQLKCENEKVRELATDVLGKIFVDSGSRVALTYPAVWRIWMERRNDKNVHVRILWLQFCPDAFRHHPELCNDLKTGFEQKFCDPDEKVRLAAIKVMSELDAVSLVNVPRELLLHLADRCKDKKINIRLEAIEALARIFDISYADIVSDENQAAEKYGWIPGCILELAYLGDLETLLVMERTLHEHIFPYPGYDTERTDRLLRIVGALTDKQHKALMSIIDKQAAMLGDFKHFIDFCERWNGGILDHDDGTIEETLNRVIQFLSNRFPDPKKAAASLQKFAKNNESRFYALFRGLMKESADFKVIVKNQREITKRLEPHSSFSDVIKVILRRVSLMILGKSSIPRLIEVAKSAAIKKSGDFSMANTTVDLYMQRLAASAEILIKKLASSFPPVYGSHLKEFLAMLTSDDELAVSDCLEGISKYIKAFPDQVILNSEEQEIVIKYSLCGSLSQAKHAATILGMLADSEPRDLVIRTLSSQFRTPKLVANAVAKVESFGDDLDSLKSFSETEDMAITKLPTWLVTVAQLQVHASLSMEGVDGLIADVVVKDILMKTHVLNDPHDGEDYINFESLHFEGILKTVGLKFLVNRARSKETANDVANHLVEGLQKLLITLIESEGELLPAAKGTTCNAFRSHLRQTAATSILKLTKLPGFERLMTIPDRSRLMLMIQDPCWQIRDLFVEKLRKYLQIRAIPFHYIVILCMAALEPDDDIKAKAKTFLLRFAKSQRDTDSTTLEHIFVDVLHMIAHHPDFGMESEEITDSAKYIQFFLEIVATPENVSFLFHSAAQLKTLVDIYAEKSSESIYHISDLSQFLIQEFCKQHQWTLNSYPDVIQYKRHLFKKLPSTAGNENVKKSYLSKSWMESTQKANLIKSKPVSRRRSSVGRAKKELIAEDEESDNENNVSMEQDEAEVARGANKKRKSKDANGRLSKSGRGGAKKRKSDASTDGEVIAVRPKSTRNSNRKSATYAETDESMDEPTLPGNDSESEEEPLKRVPRKPIELPKNVVVPSQSDSNGSQ